MIGNWVGGIGLSALCVVELSPEMRALAFSTNVWGGLVFLMLAARIFDMRDVLLPLVPRNFGFASVSFLLLCGVHHLLHALTVIVDLSRLDSVVVGLMALAASVALWMLHFEVPAWAERHARKVG